MAAGVEGDPMYTRALTPQVMELIGRALIRRGDAVFFLDTSNGLTLIPASDSQHRRRAYLPSSWVYDITLARPWRAPHLAARPS